MCLPFAVYGAGETGQGEATISPSAILTGEALPLGLVQLTFTAKTTNMVEGVVFVKIPNAAYAPANVAAVLTDGDAGEISAAKLWVDGTSTYVGVTVTADIDATVGLRWALAAAPMSVTGTLTWTVYSATDATTTYTAEAIGTLPTTVITSSNKAASVVSQAPVALTPVLTTNTDAFTWIINLDTYYKAGNVRIDRPNDTWADFSNNTYAAGYFKKTGAGGTPTVVANYVNIPVAAATAGQDITITYGGGDPSVLVRKDEYGEAQIFAIRANAISAAATETPIATSIRLDVWVATPTVAVSVKSYNENGSIDLSFNPLNDAESFIAISATPVERIGRNTNRYNYKLPVGATSFEVVMKYTDYDNDRSTRYSVSNTLSAVNMGKWLDDYMIPFSNNDLVKGVSVIGNSALDVPYQVKFSATPVVVLEVKQAVDEVLYWDVDSNSGNALTYRGANTSKDLFLISQPVYVAGNSYLLVTSPANAGAHTNTLTVRYMDLGDYKKIIR